MRTIVLRRGAVALLITCGLALTWTPYARGTTAARAPAATAIRPPSSDILASRSPARSTGT